MARSGMLNRVIELWRKTASKNDYGEREESWQFVRNIRAYTYRATGAQIMDNDEVFDVIHVDVTMRNQTDISENDRLKFDGYFYQIEFIQPDDTKRWLLVKCTRINE